MIGDFLSDESYDEYEEDCNQTEMESALD